MTIWTIGHSTHPAGQFVSLLTAHGIEHVADIRTVPRSRRNPQFNTDTLPHTLAAHHIGYAHLAGLGGLRHPRKDSINSAWRNDSFRGYADYMQTTEFDRHLAELIAVARTQRTAIMCAESVPWRCHRSLVADALTARGIDVRHILSATAQPKPHQITPFARIDGERVTYPGVLG